MYWVNMFLDEDDWDHVVIMDTPGDYVIGGPFHTYEEAEKCRDSYVRDETS